MKPTAISTFLERHPNVVAVILSLATLMAGCAHDTSQVLCPEPAPVASAVSSAHANVMAGVLDDGDPTPELDTAKFRAALADPNTLVFDARPEAEFAVSHVPGARSVPGKPGLSDAQYTADASRVIQMVPDRSRQLVLYCNGPFCGRSRRFAAELRNAGYKNVWRYQLGIPTWRALGGATQTERDALLALLAADHTAVLVDARESSAAVPALLSAKRIALADTTRAKDDGRLPMTDHNTRIFVVGDNAAQAQAVAEAIAKDAFHNVSFFAGGVAQLPELAAPSSVPIQASSAR
jgi:rhodanese-related sulfurtransferase